jgi:hypothetical protein
VNDVQRARLATYLEVVRRTRLDPEFRAAVGVPEDRLHTVVPLAAGDDTDWLLDRVDERDGPVVAAAVRDGELAAYVVFRVVTA